MPSLKELRDQLDTENEGLHKFLEEHTNKDGQYDMTADDILKLNQWNDDITALGKEYDEVRQVEVVAKEVKRRQDEAKEILRPEFPVGTYDPSQKGGGRDMPEMKSTKSLGDLVTEHKDFSALADRWRVSLKEFDTKTLMATSAGWAPFVNRRPGFVEYALRRPMLQDLIPTIQVEESAVKYMEETTATNNAAPVAEGANNKPESALAYTERTVPMEVIAHWIPVTRQQLRFVPQVRAAIDNRLTMFLMLAEETQLLTGNGTSPQLQGFLTKTGVQTQAKGSDPTPDACYKAMTLVRATGFAEPDGFVFHPNDWQDIRLLRTVDGIYIWGSPAEAGPERIWGKSIIQTTAQTENTALTGDFGLYSELYRGGGVEIFVTDSHASLFIQNTLAILAEMFSALAILRAAAFAKVTGI